MASVAETLNSKPPLGAALAAGVQTLSMDQELLFSLYRRYVFPLDGMNYWVKIPSSQGSITTPGIQPNPGLASQTIEPGEAIQVSPGGIGSQKIVGGTITNPESATDQGLSTAESLFVDFTGPAYSHVTATTSELQPGESIEIPENCTSGAWVCAASGGHQFTVVILKTLSSVTLPTDVQVKGSFHYSSLINQEEDAIFDSNEVIFTSLSEIQPFNQIGPDYLYICHFDGLTFAFSSRGRLYEQADLYHYRGSALRSRHLTQIIEDASQFNPTLVVSNSLPIWLNMPNYVPPYPGFTCPLPLYPSYLVDDNLPPPFGSIHIEDTECIEMGSVFGPRLQQSQLAREKVRIHLYGADNLMASNFVAFVEQYSLDWMKLGLSDSPAIKDVKLTSPEFKTLAQRKMVEFDINYRQNVVRDEARQFILHAKVQFIPQWLVDPNATYQPTGIVGV
jgi:hypothetical protein